MCSKHYTWLTDAAAQMWHTGEYKKRTLGKVSKEIGAMVDLYATYPEKGKQGRWHDGRPA